MVSPRYQAAIEAVKLARVERGISQRELARRLGKPPSFVNKIELLERRLDVVEFIAIATALQIEPSALLLTLVREMPKDAAEILAG